MVTQKGFSLTELIVVLVVVGIISAIAIPSYIVNVQAGYAKAACNNLNVIANAEMKYYLSTGQYCTNSNGSTCGDTYADLNKNLNLSISDSKFSYACALTAPTGFLCTATMNPGSGNTLVAIPMPSNSYQMMSSGGVNTAIQIKGGCVPTVPCSGINNCSTDNCGTSCGTCSGAGVACSSNVAGTPGQCTCPNTCPTTGSPCGNDTCGHLCGNCQVPPNTCHIVAGNTVGTCVTAGAVCAPGSCGIKDANGNACNCPDSTYSCNASHQCYQCPDLPGNTTACPNNLNQSSTVYTVVSSCGTPGVCQAFCDPSKYNIVGGTECVLNAACGPPPQKPPGTPNGISCAQGVPINEKVDGNYNTTWNCQSGINISSLCSAPAMFYEGNNGQDGDTTSGSGSHVSVNFAPYSNCKKIQPCCIHGTQMTDTGDSCPGNETGDNDTCSLSSTWDPQGSHTASCSATCTDDPPHTEDFNFGTDIQFICSVSPVESCIPGNVTASCSSSS